MRLEKCYFCSSTCYPGHGTMFVRNDSKVTATSNKQINMVYKATALALSSGYS